MRTLLANFLSLSLALTLGCAFQKPVSFSSEPMGASVRVGGRQLGTTPLTSELKCRTGKNEEREYEVTKDGYRKQSGELTYRLSVRNLVIDILFFPFGGVGKVMCPKPNYQFELLRETATLRGKATLVVSELVSDGDVYIGPMRVHEGERLLLPPGWQVVNMKREDALVRVAEVHLDPDTDYVVGLLAHWK